MGINAFCKTGNTVTFTAGVTAPTPVQVSSTTLGGNQYRIINAGQPEGMTADQIKTFLETLS